MRIRIILAAMFLCLALSPAMAEEMAHMMAEEHGGGTFHMFRLETDYGAGQNGAVASWDFDGWIGGDDNKLWLKSEGETSDGKTEQAEFWALYSRNIATFWDAQIGLRHDTRPSSTTYLAMGFEGLAPYFFETEVHIFVSENGDFSLRLREENDFLLTQKLILQPYAEINLSANDVPENHISSGFTNGEIGLQTRYEFTRKFAPYLDLRYERKFGDTASMATSDGEDKDDFIAAIGLRLMF
ncbi:MAG: copper resistance protein B [Alphaproteobacteria bacterium]|nr:MAG: copper resistance protein B [Alphaproteobacteria bacterium]